MRLPVGGWLLAFGMGVGVGVGAGTVVGALRCLFMTGKVAACFSYLKSIFGFRPWILWRTDVLLVLRLWIGGMLRAYRAMTWTTRRCVSALSRSAYLFLRRGNWPSYLNWENNFPSNLAAQIKLILDRSFVKSFCQSTTNRHIECRLQIRATPNYSWRIRIPIIYFYPYIYLYLSFGL